jgi:hypothetical protein
MVLEKWQMLSHLCVWSMCVCACVRARIGKVVHWCEGCVYYSGCLSILLIADSLPYLAEPTLLY